MENEDYRLNLKGKEEKLDIRVYINRRGTISRFKTIGFEPIVLKVPREYHSLGDRGKAIFLQKAYEERMKGE